MADAAAPMRGSRGRFVRKQTEPAVGSPGPTARPAAQCDASPFQLVPKKLTCKRPRRHSEKHDGVTSRDIYKIVGAGRKQLRFYNEQDATTYLNFLNRGGVWGSPLPTPVVYRPLTPTVYPISPGENRMTRADVFAELSPNKPCDCNNRKPHSDWSLVGYCPQDKVGGKVQYSCNRCHKKVTIDLANARRHNGEFAVNTAVHERHTAHAKPVESLRITGGTTSAHSSCDCPACKQYIPTDPLAVGNDLGRQAVVAFVLTNQNASYTRYAEQQKLEGKHPYCERWFVRIVHELAAAVNKVMDEQIALGRMDMKKLPVEERVVTCDGCFEHRGHSSTLATVDVTCRNNGCIVGVVHVALKATEAHGHTVPYKGTAKGAEGMGVDVAMADLESDDCGFGKISLDGDSNSYCQVKHHHPHAQLIPCFNHANKAACKRAMALVLTKVRDARAKLSGDELNRCKCTGNHTWTATESRACCGCANVAYCTHVQACIHAIGSGCKGDGTKFATLCEALKKHIAGNHEDCQEFHPSKRCNCDAKCKVRDCTCAADITDCSRQHGIDGCDCPGDVCTKPTKRCFGKPREPTCEGTPWVSALPPVTCKFHLRILTDQIDAMATIAPALFASSLGKLDTCRNECIHKFILDARMKGLVMSPWKYELVTEIGMLRANAIAMYLLKTKMGVSVNDVSELVWEHSVYKHMGLTLTDGATRLDKLKTAVKDSDRRASEYGKFAKMMAKRNRALREAQRRLHDGARNYDSAKFLADLAPNADRFEKLEMAALCIFFDIEFPGHSVYGDPVMELGAAVGIRDEISGIVYKVEDIDDFVQRSCVKCVNPRAPGHAHLNLDELAHEQDEETLIRNFVQWVSDVRNGSALENGELRPVYLVAHNGNVTEAIMLTLALQRAGYDPKRVGEELGICGMLDTLDVCRRVTDWGVVPGPAAAVAASAPDTDDDSESESGDDSDLDGDDATEHRGARKKKQTWPAPAIASSYSDILAKFAKKEGAVPEPTVSASDCDAFDEDSLVIALMPQDAQSNSLSAVYQRLFGNGFAGTHQAQADVHALIDVFLHDKVWPIVDQTWCVQKWTYTVDHVLENYEKHLKSKRGWRFENYCECVHGPMSPKEFKDETYSDGWRVTFFCRRQTCPQVHMSSHPSFVTPPAAATSGTKRTPSDHGTVGACTCNGQCQRSCPCKSSKQQCQPACHPAHQCKNVPTVPIAATPVAVPS